MYVPPLVHISNTYVHTAIHTKVVVDFGRSDWRRALLKVRNKGKPANHAIRAFARRT
jgi:hypothetical protein